MTGLSLVAGGWASNLIVYLITEYNVKSITATKISNIVLGCYSLFPVVGAIIADSFLGSFPVVAIFSFVSLLVIFVYWSITEFSISFLFFIFDKNDRKTCIKKRRERQKYKSDPHIHQPRLDFVAVKGQNTAKRKAGRLHITKRKTRGPIHSQQILIMVHQGGPYFARQWLYDSHWGAVTLR